MPLIILSMRDDTNPFVKGIKNNVISLQEKWEKEEKLNNLRSFCERITQESFRRYVEVDELKALSGGKYGGYPICGQTKPYEYSYMHYIFHPYGVW